MARLLDILVNYARILFAGTVCIMNPGADTATLLAFVGIAGLGLSLGAKNLIMDVIAGISIIFEGEFRAGDIAEIGGKTREGLGYREPDNETHRGWKCADLPEQPDHGCPQYDEGASCGRGSL